MSILKELIRLANHLDEKGFKKEADRVDNIVKLARDSMQPVTLEEPVIPEDSPIRGARDRYLKNKEQTQN